MLVKGCSSVAQLRQISIFQDLAVAQLESLIPFSYIREYQIARSIGISYEECVRLFKKLNGIVSYKRGGTTVVFDWSELAVFYHTV